MFPQNESGLDRRLRAWTGGGLLLASLLSLAGRGKAFGTVAGLLGAVLLGLRPGLCTASPASTTKTH